MSRECKQRFSSFSVPQSYRAVFTGAGEGFAVWAESYAYNLTRMPEQPKDEIARSGIPNFHGGIKVTCCNARSIGAGSDACYIRSPTRFAENEQLFARANVPGGDSRFFTARIKAASIGAEGDKCGRDFLIL